MVTIEDAYILARKIKERSPKIHSVELFGSVAERGKGRDLDLLLIVDDELAQKFWSMADDLNPRLPLRLLFVRKIIKKLFYSLDEAFVKKLKQTRNLRVSALIGLDLVHLGEEYRPGTAIDAWIMPVKWQSRITEITNNSNMMGFLNNAARFAVKLV